MAGGRSGGGDSIVVGVRANPATSIKAILSSQINESTDIDLKLESASRDGHNERD
jgi:hypothetical protein